MACPICQASETGAIYRTVRDFEHNTNLTASFDRCQACGVLFQNPVPDAGSLRTLYPADYRASSAGGLYGKLKYIQALMVALRLRKHIGDRTSNILELGCGPGLLLRALSRLGFSTLSGVDWTINTGLTGKSPTIHLIVQDITTYVPPRPVDVLILNNVLEHICDPLVLLQNYRQYLSHNGLIILLTPNASALSAGFFGRYWSGLHAPWHMNVFTQKSLAALAARSNFVLRKIAVSEDPGSWAVSVQNWLRSLRRSNAPSSGFGPAALLGLFCSVPLALLALVTGRGSSLFAVLQSRTSQQ